MNDIERVMISLSAVIIVTICIGAFISTAKSNAGQAEQADNRNIQIHLIQKEKLLLRVLNETRDGAHWN